MATVSPAIPPGQAGGAKRSLGDILIEAGIISPLELDEALQRQRLTGDFLGRVLVRMELCEEEEILEALGVQMGMERVDLTKLKIKDEVLRKVPPDVAKFYNVVPVREEGDGTLVLAMADPLNIDHLDDLEQILGCRLKGAVSNLHDVSQSLNSNYSYESDSIHETLQDLLDRVGDKELSLEELGQQKIIGDVDNLIELAQEPEVIKIVNLVLLEAVQKHASDIHYEVYEEEYRIRLRIMRSMEIPQIIHLCDQPSSRPNGASQPKPNTCCYRVHLRSRDG